MSDRSASVELNELTTIGLVDIRTITCREEFCDLVAMVVDFFSFTIRCNKDRKSEILF